MTQRNCKNCGAPLEHSYNHKCKYCGTLYDFNEPKEKTIKITPQDLINIELREIIRLPFTENYVLVFSGYKVSMPKIYEVNDNNYTSQVEEYVNPPKCIFCIEIPIEAAEKYGIGYVMHYIESAGVRYNELEKIRKQIYASFYGTIEISV